MEQLLALLTSIHPLSDELLAHLATILKQRTIEKKEYILKVGQICRYVYFIQHGLLRCYYERNDQEISSWFMKEGDVIFSVESFFLQAKSQENIQALEMTSVFYISYNELQHIYQTFPEFNFVGRVLTERYYALSEQRIKSLRMMRASERYDFLTVNYPEIVSRVPSKYIASYLGITIETLSRIRAQF